MAHKWWQRGVVYQIYPRSLQDSNGDGVGDIGGILQRVDYFASLAVDALWLYLTNGNVLGGGQTVLTGPAFIDSSNVAQVAAYAARGTR